MAWLKGLAGKAEDFLNQIDQNAAVALQIEKREVNQKDALLTEVTWDSQPSVRDVPTTTATTWASGNTSTIPSVRSSPNLGALTPTRTAKTHNDDELIKFLNSSEPAEKNNVQEQIVAISSINSNAATVSENSQFSPVAVETIYEKTNGGHSESSRSSSKRSSPREVLPESLPIPQLPTVSHVESVRRNDRITDDLRTENVLLKNELRSLNNEMSMLLHRAKAAEKECGTQLKQLEGLQEKADRSARLETELQTALQQVAAAQELAQSLQLENDRFVQICADSTGSHNHALEVLQEQMESVQAAHHQEITALKDRLTSIELERSGLASHLADVQQQLVQSQASAASLQQQCDRVRGEVKEARTELDQYRARAQRILQDKERLIGELRGEGSLSSGGGPDDATALELEQLRQERELLREESGQVSARLQASRDELEEAEKRLEKCREAASQSQQLLQEERNKRQSVEEDCRTHAEELRSVREELSRQRSLLASRVREREAELTRLRGQLSQRPVSPLGDELESRLHTLTQTLVQKQSSLESVTTEKNALRLQLEKMEHKHRDVLALLHQNQSGLISVNDTDDAKAQVPSFFMETPFDTGMTRRVKRAYSSLDAVSIRTGVFLRRYPLARILVLCYMVLLHLWVMLVLFTYTPQPH